MIEVFYIAYLKTDFQWGILAFKRFLNSYEKFSAGVEHSLTVLLRGYENNLKDYNEIKEICKNKNIKTLDTQDIGLDFGAYLDGAQQSSAEYICGINTTCIIMCDNWLEKLYSTTEKDSQYKFVGVSGSYELCPEYVRELKLIGNLKDKIKSLCQNLNIFRILYRFIFTPKMKGFPNYSVRTSSFLIDKNIYLEYFKTQNLPKNKLEAYKLENGKNSISNFITEKGLKYCIVDKSGRKYDKEVP